MSKFIILGCLIFLASLVFLRDTPLGVADFPSRDCVAFRSWLTSKTKTQPEIERILPPPEDKHFSYSSVSDDGSSTSEWSAVAKNILSWAGWPSSRMHFASFRSYTYNQLIQSPKLQLGAFLIVIPGPSEVKLDTRNFEEPWITASPASFGNALPLKALDTLAMALESRQSRLKSDENFSGGNRTSTSTGADYEKESSTTSMRRLHPFHIEVAPSPYAFPLCRGRGGACAIWEGSTGRVILDADVARRISSSPTIARLLDKFTLSLASMLHSSATSMESGKRRKMAGNLENNDIDDITEESLSSSLVNGSFFSTISQSINRNRDDNKGEGEEQSEEYRSSAESIGAFIAKAATAAITSVLLGGGGNASGLGRQPLWWCLTCPIVLGLLAPFVINFGLAAAAEQLCAALQLPADECSDLWWGAFALAMALSLGSAVPIVYVCRLPDCIKRALN